MIIKKDSFESERIAFSCQVPLSQQKEQGTIMILSEICNLKRYGSCQQQNKKVKITYCSITELFRRKFFFSRKMWKMSLLEPIEVEPGKLVWNTHLPVVM